MRSLEKICTALDIVLGVRFVTTISSGGVKIPCCWGGCTRYDISLEIMVGIHFPGICEAAGLTDSLTVFRVAFGAEIVSTFIVPIV